MTTVVVFLFRAWEMFINETKQEIYVENIEVIAWKIAKQSSIDLIKLEEINDYPESYNETISRTGMVYVKFE